MPNHTTRGSTLTRTSQLDGEGAAAASLVRVDALELALAIRALQSAAVLQLVHHVADFLEDKICAVKLALDLRGDSPRQPFELAFEIVATDALNLEVEERRVNLKRTAELGAGTQHDRLALLGTCI